MAKIKETTGKLLDKTSGITGKTTGFIAEFKKFISRGNVLDMAVGVIVGGAFTAIVSSLVDDLLMPIIGMILAGVNFKELNVTIPWGNNPVLHFGSFIQAIITFLLTALCVFIIIKLINSFQKKKEEAPAAPAADIALLTEIRDLLKSSTIVPEAEESEETKETEEATV